MCAKVINSVRFLYQSKEDTSIIAQSISKTNSIGDAQISQVPNVVQALSLIEILHKF